MAEARLDPNESSDPSKLKEGLGCYLACSHDKDVGYVKVKAHSRGTGGNEHLRLTLAVVCL